MSYFQCTGNLQFFCDSHRIAHHLFEKKIHDRSSWLKKRLTVLGSSV